MDSPVIAQNPDISKKWKRVSTYRKLPQTCHYCGRKLTYRSGGDRDNGESDASLDHKTPLVLDGCVHRDSKNVVICCRQCNTRKGSIPHELFTVVRQDGELVRAIYALFDPNEMAKLLSRKPFRYGKHSVVRTKTVERLKLVSVVLSSELAVKSCE